MVRRNAKMDEMEKNELEKNEELEPKEAVETKEEPTQEEACACGGRSCRNGGRTRNGRSFCRRNSRRA